MSAAVKSSDDRRRARELEEARKAGTIPAERDAEGNEINPHIPQFMAQAPWYLNQDQPGLGHQRNLKEQRPVATVTDFRPRGLKAGPALSVYRKGACENCGAVTHLARVSSARAGRALSASDRGAWHYWRVEARRTAGGALGGRFAVPGLWAGLPFSAAALAARSVLSSSRAPTRFLDLARSELPRELACPPSLAPQDCVERPRKKGAKYSGKDIKPDEVSVELAYDYAGKRDHWQQFDPSAHMAMIRAHEREAETRRKAAQQRKMGELAAKEQQRERRQKKKEGTPKGADGADGSGTDTDTDTDASGDGKVSDEERVAETEQLSIGQDVKAPAGRAKSSVRNLRIREDTAKYLLNLDVSSAYYDPKTRAMRENPLPGHGGGEEDGFAGDNFQRASGDAAKLAALQMYELEAFDKGQNMQMNADPTTVEMMNRIYREKKAKLKDTRSNKILDKYGGQQHLEPPPKELLFAQTENYVEYDRSGGVVQGQEKVVARSKYEEDVLSHNHVEIWGSYFDRATFRWGYADDHSTLRNSYSTGAAGRRAREMAAAALKAPAPTHAAVAGQAAPALVDRSQAALEQRALYGTGEGLGDAPLDAEKLKAAMAAEAKRRVEGAAGADDRKRKYNSMQAEEVTAESMEAYYRSKARGDDPMAGV